MTPRRNLEHKFRCDDLAAVRAALPALAPRAAGVQVQTDTFFRARAGRLKLREIEGQPAVLIWYDRTDAAAAKLSTYHLVPVGDAALLRTALTAALGVRGVVRKRREIHLWKNIRIHLDEVEGLLRAGGMGRLLSRDDHDTGAVEHAQRVGGYPRDVDDDLDRVIGFEHIE